MRNDKGKLSFTGYFVHVWSKNNLKFNDRFKENTSHFNLERDNASSGSFLREAIESIH